MKAVGDLDKGKSFGPYQIQEAYFKEAVQQDPSLSKLGSFPGAVTGADAYKNSEAIMLAYSNKYTTEKRIGCPPTNIDAARNHNGGPNGYKKASTECYAEKFKKPK